MRVINGKIGIIILAAGGSKRLGQPKQLLKFEGKTLIRRSVETALNSKCSPIILVLGANFSEIKNEVSDLKCEIVFNENWRSGMSSSIKIGLSKLLELSPDVSAVIVSLADQPLIKSTHFDNFIETFSRTTKPIIASFYNETVGVPALFAKDIFPVLLNLEGDKGAKTVLKNHPESVEIFFLPEAEIDIDTQADFEKLNNI